MNKFVVYTSVTGGYDTLPQYGALDSRFDYICFTNDYPAGSKVGQWLIHPIPANVADDKISLSRYAKLMPHEVVPEYEWSLWIDANISIEDNALYDHLIKIIEAGDKAWYGLKHPERDCIYDEAKCCIIYHRATYRQVKTHIAEMKGSSYPRHYGLFENNVILRQHNNQTVTAIDNDWWERFMRISKRDQLSLFYIFWLHDFTPGLLLEDGSCTRDNGMFKYIPHPRSTKSLRSRLTPSRIRYAIKYRIESLIVQKLPYFTCFKGIV